MRIVVIADHRLPAAWSYPGHGLGKSCLAIAEGLAGRGYAVTLVAAPGSAADGCEVIAAESAEGLARRAFAAGPDVVIDGSHEHFYQRFYPGYPVINRSGDREGKPGRNAVYVSRAHAEYFGDGGGEVVYTGVPVGRVYMGERSRYLLWLGPVEIPHKQVDMAIRVASRAGRPLVIAGTGWLAHEGFVGPVYGESKRRLIRQAAAVLVTGAIEAGPRTAIEAAAEGTPVIGLAAGGTPEYIGDGESGFVCSDEAAMVAAVQRLAALDPARVQGWVAAHRGYAQMISGYERLAVQAANQAVKLAG